MLTEGSTQERSLSNRHTGCYIVHYIFLMHFAQTVVINDGDAVLSLYLIRDVAVERSTSTA